MRVLITGGGCEEPIDGVRSVCNFSTGRTASHLADRFYERGFEVTAVLAERAAKPDRPVAVRAFRTFRDLSEILRALLGAQTFDLVVHAAAVSDFAVASVVVDGKEHAPGSIGKIESGSALSLIMRENPKILGSLKAWSKNKNCAVAAFKLTNGASRDERERAAAELFVRNGEDTGLRAVVSNDLAEISADAHPFRVYARKEGRSAGAGPAVRCIAEGRTKQDLANFLGGLG